MKELKSENVSKLNPLVSVDIITYNHSKYITETIEGVLMQKTNFIYEIVICDDFSIDGTREILLDYQNKFSDKIILRLQDQNLGLRYNYFENKKYCRGKYIAILEGDDYWTDPFKLQKQVDFLDQNELYSMCFTNSMEVFDFAKWTKDAVPFAELENKDYSGSELLSKWLVPTATVMYRNNISYNFKNLDLFLFYDIPLFLKLSESGKIRGFDEITAIYRRHDNAITNQEISTKKYFTHLRSLNQEFDKKYSSLLPYLFAQQYFLLSKFFYKQGSVKALYYALLSLFNDTSILLPQFNRKIKGIFYKKN